MDAGRGLSPPVRNYTDPGARGAQYATRLWIENLTLRPPRTEEAVGRRRDRQATANTVDLMVVNPPRTDSYR